MIWIIKGLKFTLPTTLLEHYILYNPSLYRTLTSARVLGREDIKRLQHINVKKLTPRIKNVKIAFLWKKRKKRWIKNVVDKLTKLFKPNWKILH